MFKQPKTARKLFDLPPEVQLSIDERVRKYSYDLHEYANYPGFNQARVQVAVEEFRLLLENKAVEAQLKEQAKQYYVPEMRGCHL